MPFTFWRSTRLKTAALNSAFSRLLCLKSSASEHRWCRKNLRDMCVTHAVGERKLISVDVEARERQPRDSSQTSSCSQFAPLGTVAGIAHGNSGGGDQAA